MNVDSSNLAIGIDLGTSNSSIAYVDVVQDTAEMVPLNDSTSLPSLFTINESGMPLVGLQAQNSPSQNIVHSSKRLIGRNFHRSEDLQQLFTYEISTNAQNQPVVELYEQLFTLEDISASIIKELLNHAQQHLNQPITQAVLTVPTYFDEGQRRSIQRAGELAGINVLRILNEPTAAALAYGNKKNFNKTVAIYDIGGGTFDLSIVKIQGNSFEVLASGGNPQLGGVDFDDRILRFLLNEIYDTYGFDLAIDKQALTTLRALSEQAKIALSDHPSITISEQLYSEEDEEEFLFSYVLYRHTLEDITRDLVTSTIKTARTIIEESNLALDALEEILLVGGQSLMPMVTQELEKAFGKKPLRHVHPKEIVAKGAALMASSILAKEKSSLNLQDRLPMSIGIRKSDGSINVLFAKGCSLPTQQKRTLPTVRNNQSSILLHLYQGEETFADQNEALQSFLFSGLREAPKGVVKIEVLFRLNEGGLLSMVARDKHSKHTISIQAITPKELEMLKKQSEQTHRRDTSQNQHAVRQQQQKPQDADVSTTQKSQPTHSTKRSSSQNQSPKQISQDPTSATQQPPSNTPIPEISERILSQKEAQKEIPEKKPSKTKKDETPPQKKPSVPRINNSKITKKNVQSLQPQKNSSVVPKRLTWFQKIRRWLKSLIP